MFEHRHCAFGVVWLKSRYRARGAMLLFIDIERSDDPKFRARTVSR